jgi:ligand-binding sensor domain-containing protein
MEDARPTLMAVSGDLSSRREIWVGTNGYGIVVIQTKTGDVVRHTAANGLPSNDIRAINTAGETYHFDYRYVWVATDQGIGYWDGERWTTYTTVDGLPANDVRSVGSIGGQRGSVWAATAGGVGYFDGQAWQAFTQADGLPEGDLNGVEPTIPRDEDGTAQVWFSTRESGLILFVAQLRTR